MSWFDVGAAAVGAIGGLLGNKQASGATASLDRKNRDWQDANWRREQQALLGSNWKGIHSGIGADAEGRQRDVAQTNEMQRNAMNIGMQEYGLTPQEIMGGSAPGGTASGGNTTLGNNMAQANAVRAQSRERDADRAVQLKTTQMNNQTAFMSKAMESGIDILGQGVQKRGQDMQMTQTQMNNATAETVSKIAARAQVSSSSITAAATKYAAALNSSATMYAADVGRLNMTDQLRETGRLNDAKITQINAQAGFVLADTQIKAELHSERWKTRLAGMPPEQFVQLSVALANGLDGEAMVRDGKLKGSQLEAAKQFNQETLSRKGKFGPMMAAADERLDDMDTKGPKGSSDALLRGSPLGGIFGPILGRLN